MDNVVLSLLAHPDDAEFLCTGTMARLVQEHGYRAHIATMTPGDCGSADQSSEVISNIRREEGRKAAALLHAEYHCLEERDLLVFYDAPTLKKVTTLIRQIQPTLVFTHSPDDYMLDHEMTSLLGRAACFNAPIPNFCSELNPPPPLAHIPHLYYCDPIEGKDKFGHEVEATTFVNIEHQMELKERMLACHASQREWLMKHHGMDQYLLSMKEWAAKRGSESNVTAAEGFRQHLGHSYPQDDLLKSLFS